MIGKAADNLSLIVLDVEELLAINIFTDTIDNYGFFIDRSQSIEIIMQQEIIFSR